MSRRSLFDPVFYLREYPDVAAAGVDPFRHYLSHGVREGRHANACFDTAYYLAQVSARPRDPTRHYLIWGAARGLDPHPHFDARWYRSAYPDVAEAGADPLSHYLAFGRSEGRETEPHYQRILGPGPRLEWRSAPGVRRAGKGRLRFEPLPPTGVDGHFVDDFALLADFSRPQRDALLLGLEACGRRALKRVTLDVELARCDFLRPSTLIKFGSCHVRREGEALIAAFAEALVFDIVEERQAFAHGFAAGAVVIENLRCLHRRGPSFDQGMRAR